MNVGGSVRSCNTKNEPSRKRVVQNVVVVVHHLYLPNVSAKWPSLLFCDDLFYLLAKVSPKILKRGPKVSKSSYYQGQE